ncbi:hypothetical protein VMCG_06565 [Cytospora schulzeri]|uniref:Uncharacterized protein n=1 Tax=Cytospora schulzeri TaxID=448051 RepID=A0A423WBM4_9PEZI|nr:hypothetical protein VMCG_06565 [Valsa malicola]
MNVTTSIRGSSVGDGDGNITAKVVSKLLSTEGRADDKSAQGGPPIPVAGNTRHPDRPCCGSRQDNSGPGYAESGQERGNHS